MNSPDETAAGTLPRWILIAAILAFALLALGKAVASPPALLSAIMVVLTEGGLAALVVVSAGGYGALALRPLRVHSAPAGLWTVTAAAAGLWMLSTAVLAVGSLSHGLLRGWLWWPVIGIGAILAAWQGRAGLEGWRPPARLDGRSLVWIVVAISVGLAVAGATLPPGYIPTFDDDYDVLEYHLQLPREYHVAQHVAPLDHNVYSHYPLGLEMLYLLTMCLRGGSFEGMYAAKMMHLAFGALAVAAVYLGLRGEQDSRSRFSAGLLATAPLTVYLGWLAMVELSQVCFLALALLWLRIWMRDREIKSAAVIGLLLGAACAFKYLSAMFIVLPVLAAMLIWAVFRPRTLWQPLLAAVLAAVVFSPWMVRNAIATGNPVFPLASKQLGRGYWTAELERRWLAGHSPDRSAPVPLPPDWKELPQPSRAEMFYTNFIFSQWFGPLNKLLAAVAVCVLIASTRRVDPWDWALVGVLVVQLAAWAAFTAGMPPRFLAPSLVPMALLGGAALAQLGRIRGNPFRRGSDGTAPGNWGMKLSVPVFVAAALVNVLVTYGVYRLATPDIAVNGVSGADVAANALPWKQAYQLPPASRILMVGEAKMFYYPAGTRYATTFDPQPLDDLVRADPSPAAVLDGLRRRGITHLWFDWREIRRLARTYGFPASLSAEVVRRWAENLPPDLDIIDGLKALGMTVAGEINMPRPTTASASTGPATSSAPASAPASTPASVPAPQGPDEWWPVATIYALPKADAPDVAASGPAR